MHVCDTHRHHDQLPTAAGPSLTNSNEKERHRRHAACPTKGPHPAKQPWRWTSPTEVILRGGGPPRGQGACCTLCDRPRAARPQLCSVLWARPISEWTSVIHQLHAGCWGPRCPHPCHAQGPRLSVTRTSADTQPPMVQAAPRSLCGSLESRSLGVKGIPPPPDTYTRCKSTGPWTVKWEVVTLLGSGVGGQGAWSCPASLSRPLSCPSPTGAPQPTSRTDLGSRSRDPCWMHGAGFRPGQRGPGAGTLRRGHQPLSTGLGNTTGL